MYSMKLSEVMYLELSKVSKTSNGGCIQMLVELLNDYGLIDKHPTKERHHQLVSNLEHKRLRTYGDCLSMEKIGHMHNIIYYAVTRPGNTDFLHIMLQALNRCQHGVVDMHIAMYILVMIYKVYYPAILQVV